MPSVTASTAIPPISPYGILQGTLFLYHQTNLAAFETFPQRSKKCILLGGLSDGLIPTPYTTPLANLCHESGWSMVQPITSSSYLGFGHGTLERDSAELGHLMWYLTCHHSAESFCIVGHSTGCQNAIHFLKHGREDMIHRTKLVVLQAPVSDREGAHESNENLDQHLELARSLRQKQQAQQYEQQNDSLSSSSSSLPLLEMMPRSAFWAPITAQRFLDLFEKGGADDFFSSDWTDDELQERLQHVSSSADVGEQLQAVLVAFSGADEYVPSHIDKLVLTQRLCQAMNRHRSVAIPLYLEHANHNLSQDEHAIPNFLASVKELLQKIN